MTAIPELVLCPVCRGVGFHLHGFYTATENPNGSTAINISTEKCRSCNNGIIGLPTPDPRLRDAAEKSKELLKAIKNGMRIGLSTLRDKDFKQGGKTHILACEMMEDGLRCFSEYFKEIAALAEKETG